MKTDMNGGASRNTIVPLIGFKLPFVCHNYSLVIPYICFNRPSVFFTIKNKGFTLIELVMVVVLIGILAALAAPNMSSFLLRNQVATQINELVGDINLARSEAVKRGIPVALCASSNQSSCNSTNWANGWLVWVDTDGDKTLDSGEPIMRARGLLSGQPTLSASSFTPTGVIEFRSTGTIDSTAGSFKLCDRQNKNGRQLSILATGKSSVSNTTCP